VLTFILLSHNDYSHLDFLINDFVSEAPDYFKLLVVESSSRDTVQQHVNLAIDPRVSFVFDCRYGIYDSINRGISQVSSEYYIVIGLDDEFSFNKSNDIYSILNLKIYDIVFLGVKKSNINLVHYNPQVIKSGPQGVFPSHTGGSIIRKNLHNVFGNYDKSYKVVADGLFLCTVIQSGAKVALLGDIYCDIGGLGYSNNKQLLSEFESYRVRRRLGVGFLASSMVLIYRFLRRLLKIIIANVKSK
jgi:hypothetical protein